VAEIPDKGRVQGSFKSEKEQILHLEKLFQEKKFEELLILVEKVIEEFPGSFHIRLLYARVLRSLGRLNEAESILKDLSLTYPGNINLLFEMSILLVAYEKYEEAVISLNKILFLDSFNTKAKELLEKINLISSGQAPPVARTYGSTVPVPGRQGDTATRPVTPAMQRPSGQVAGPPIPPRMTMPPAPVPPAAAAMTRKQAADMFKGDTLREEDMPAIPGRTPAPPPPRPEPGPSRVQQPAVPAGAAGPPAQKFVGQEDEYMTDSAAELYLAQGLFDEALTVYRHLYRQKKDEKYQHRVDYVMTKRINQKKIQALTQLLRQIQNKGEHFV